MNPKLFCWIVKSPSTFLLALLALLLDGLHRVPIMSALHEGNEHSLLDLISGNALQFIKGLKIQHSLFWELTFQGSVHNTLF